MGVGEELRVTMTRQKIGIDVRSNAESHSRMLNSVMYFPPRRFRGGASSLVRRYAYARTQRRADGRPRCRRLRIRTTPGLVRAFNPVRWHAECALTARRRPAGHFAVLLGTAFSLLGQGAKAYRIAYLGALVSWGIVVVRPRVGRVPSLSPPRPR